MCPDLLDHLIGLLEQSKNSLTTIAKSLSGNQKNTVQEISDNFKNLNKRLGELLQLTTFISSNKTNTKPGRVALKSKVLKIEKVFELIIKKYDIEVDYSEIPNNIVITRILEAELYSILLNILSNSIKAVIAGGNKRKIKLTAKAEAGETIIIIQDSGIGLNQNKFEEVFIPFVSDPDGELYYNLDKKLNPEDGMIVGTGSGLGLGIVKEIVLSHDGSIQFMKPDKGWSSKIEIKLL